MICQYCGKEYKVKNFIEGACPGCNHKRLMLPGPKELKLIAKTQNKPIRTRKTDYSGKTISQLLNIAKTHFNRFIRERDRQGDYFTCPTCKKTKRIEGRNYQACHVFPAGHYPALRFHELNVWGGCLHCNFFKHGTNYEYNDWLRAKIGEKEYQKLIDIKNYWQRNQWKWERFYIIEIIEKYKKNQTK